MTLTVRVILKVSFLVALAALAQPLSATITYSSCSNGCSSSTGTYAAWQAALGSAGLTFSSLPATFAGGNLASGVYTDPSGTVLTGYNGASIDTLMSVSGTSLLQHVGGTNTGMEIALPANTYAFAMEITTPSGSGFTSPWVALGDHNVGHTDYNIVIASGGNVQFFGLVSDTPLTELFVGPLSGGAPIQINDFELGESTPSSPTPEASSAALIGGGLVLLGVLRRRRIHKPDGVLA
jgi:hypothetical protein